MFEKDLAFFIDNQDALVAQHEGKTQMIREEALFRDRLWRQAIMPVALSAMLIACGGDGNPVLEPQPVVVTVTVFNRLDLPISLSSGGVLYGNVPSGQSTVLTLPPGTQSLRWNSTKRRFSDGSPVPDDLDGATVQIAPNLGTIDVTNVVNGVTYMTLRIWKDFPENISVGLGAPSGVRCLGWQSGVASWGYYRLVPGTDVRYYREGECPAGRYRAWSYDQLTGIILVGSGLAQLRADVLP